jgi:hypothetical protein
MRPETGLEESPGDAGGWFPGLLALLGVIVLGGALGTAGALWLRRRGSRPHGLASDLTALLEIERLEREASQGRLVASHYAAELSRIVRTFLEERLSLAATRQTTPEFLASVQQSTILLPAQQRSLKEFLEQCDLVKFAGVQLQEEQRQALTAAARRVVTEVAVASGSLRQG